MSCHALIKLYMVPIYLPNGCFASYVFNATRIGQDESLGAQKGIADLTGVSFFAGGINL